MYHLVNGEARMFIAKDDLPEVVAALRARLGRADAGPGDVDGVFGRFGLEVSRDAAGNVDGLLVVTEMPDDRPEAAFRAIAPFVADGSYLMFIGEDAEQWGWSFRRSPATGVVEAHHEAVIPVLASTMVRSKPVHELIAKDARDALSAIVEAMYPNGDPDAAWSPDTLDAVAQVIDRHGLTPRKRRDPLVVDDHCPDCGEPEPECICDD